MVTPLFLLLAGFAAASTLLLSASLRFPEVLLDSPPVGAHPILAAAGLLGMFACGLLVPLVSRGRGRLVRRLGLAGGIFLMASAVATPVSLWGNDFLARLAFWSVTAASLVLVPWTIAMARERLPGILGALGLLLVGARSVLWAVNTWRPAVDGYWVASAFLTVLALLGFPLWLFWLVRMGLRPSRPGLVRRVAVGLAGFVLVVTHAGVVTVTTPMPESENVPAVPSAGGSAFYLMMLALSGRISATSDVAAMREHRNDDRYAKPENPPGATLDHVDANGVPADWICAPGVSPDRAVLYLHGGGFIMPVSNGHRRFSVTLSRKLDSCVLLPNYRTAPEHPFPAPVEDTVHAYQYLRQQGIAARRIVMLGDSCGGTFTLSAALMLRDLGEELPAALVSLSGGFDITVSGPTHRTKAHSDAVLGADDVRFSADSYTDGGRIDPRDPLVSPLFADVRGLPPTLLIAGTQEVLASDSVRMADHLRDGGVPVRLEMFPGMPHDFPVIVEEIMEADLALRHISTFVGHHVS